MSHTPIMMIDLLGVTVGALSICIAVYLALLVKRCPPRYYFAYYLVGIVILLLDAEPWTSVPVGLLARFTAYLLLLAALVWGLLQIIKQNPQAHPVRALAILREELTNDNHL